MAQIKYIDTDGDKSRILPKGYFGMDDYPAGNDVGRVYIGTGTENIALAKKAEVVDLNSNQTIAGVKTFQNEIISNSSITAGQDSGSVSLTVNDGQGNANVAFNHKNGIPDTEGGSSARIIAWVDNPDAKMEFKLKSNTVKGTFETLTPIMTLRENVSEFHTPVIVPTPTTGTHAANKVYVDGKYSGFKNYIINGGFDVWQRGTSQSTLGYGSADRWFFGVGNGLVGNLNRFEIAKTNNSAWGGATFRTNINVTTTPTKLVSLLEQRIENPFRLSGKTVTVSFYASSQSSVVDGIIVDFFSNTVKINSDNVHIPVGTFTPTEEISRYSFTYTFPIFDEKTIGASDYLALRFVVPSGFLCTDLGITGVQLEEGSVATPFEQRPYGLELSLCQRYFYKESGTKLMFPSLTSSSTTPHTFGLMLFPVPMRTTPTITNVAMYNGTLIVSAQSISNTSFECTCIPTSSNSVPRVINGWTADAEL